MIAARLAYERDVRALADEAYDRIASGEGLEDVARSLVVKRNALKVSYRAPVEPALLASLEARNLQRYGDPIGPTADWLKARYGSWEAVVAASARPACLLGA